jgi:8-oxo-dGTP pyrophosphatase MutT (NUDIX family)
MTHAASAAVPHPAIQYGVLPWRMMGGVLQILLITTRNTRRWIVPKGWPVEGKSPRQSVAQEALEEAGVEGAVAAKPLGWFCYDKLRKSGELLPCKVQVFAMEVTRQHQEWEEKALRHARWVTPLEALSHVGEPGLRQIISDFAHAARAKKRRAG